MISWHGLDAVYTDSERHQMAALPAREQLVLHLLKSSFDGELSSVAEIGKRPTALALAPRPGSSGGVGSTPTAAVYTDPEDIDFGPPRLKPSQSVIELSWTWNQHRVCKTKKLANRKMRAWKRWKQRHGWKVVGGDSLIASKDGLQEAMTLRVWPKPVLTNEVPDQSLF